MTEIIQWNALTPEQRDRLVAERVINWQPVMCKATIEDIDSFAWLNWDNESQWCMWCGVRESWSSGNAIRHRVFPHPAYTQYIGHALDILNLYEEAQIYYLKQRPRGRYRVVIQLMASAHAATMESLSDAICVAALQSCGIEVQV